MWLASAVEIGLSQFLTAQRALSINNDMQRWPTSDSADDGMNMVENKDNVVFRLQQHV